MASGQVKKHVMLGTVTNGTVAGISAAATQSITAADGPGRGGEKVFQGVLMAVGTGTATVIIQASMDGTNFINEGTISLIGTTATTSSSFTPAVPKAWAYWRAAVTAIGTNSTAVIYCGEEC